MDDLTDTALYALKRHYESNDPYQDDAPSACADAKKHRKECPYCDAFEKIRDHSIKNAKVIAQRNNLKLEENQHLLPEPLRNHD